MQLWTKSGAAPVTLPAEDVDADGRIWTDLANNAEGRTACGWTAAPPAPPYDLATEDLVWSPTGEWFVVLRPQPEPVAPVVPAEVWTYQAKTVMALTTLESLGLSGDPFGLAAGATLYDAVLAAVASLPDQQRLIATIQLEGAPGTRRDAPLLASLAGPLGLTDAMIDQLFIAAAAVP